jgi:hypothetical protein
MMHQDNRIIRRTILNQHGVVGELKGNDHNLENRRMVMPERYINRFRKFSKEEYDFLKELRYDVMVLVALEQAKRRTYVTSSVLESLAAINSFLMKNLSKEECGQLLSQNLEIQAMARSADFRRLKVGDSQDKIKDRLKKAISMISI